MNGLFFRLAQQHIKQSSPGITPAPSPVFPLHGNEQEVAVTDVDQEPILTHQQPERGTHFKQHDTVMRDDLDTSVLTPRMGHKADDARQKINEPLTPSSTPASDPVNKANTAQDEVTPLTVASLLATEAGSSIQPQLPENRGSPQLPLVSEVDRQTSSQTMEDADWSPGNEAASEQTYHRHQVLPLSNGKRSVQSTQKFTRHVDGENQTTINVSIGQIDIRATHEETVEKKPSTHPRRSSSNALEEYHQKRVRGER